MPTFKMADTPQDSTFNRACRLAGIPPTNRQLRKWRRGLGIAQTFLVAAQEEARKEQEERDADAAQ